MDGGNVWCQIRIVHTELIDNIVADTKAELSEMGTNLTIQMIQHWDVAHIGFLKNLFWDVDTISLTEFIQTQLSKLHKSEAIMVGLKVKGPFDGKKRDKKARQIPFRQRVQAVHIDVRGNHAELATTHIKSILQGKLFKRRYSVDVRLIPLFDRRDSPYTQDKIRKCIVQHGQFCKCVDSMACAGIEYLDQKNTKLKLTLREMVVGLPDTHFINIDMNWRGDAFSILFPKKYEEIARDKIAHLGAYLHKHYGDKILPSLPTDAQEIIANTIWDELGRHVSQLDQELDDILASDGAIDFIDISLLTEEDIKRPSESPAISNTFVPQLDDHSVSTFRDTSGATKVTPSKSSKSKTTNDDFSTVSDVTMDSRVSKMESNFSDMKSLLQQIYDREVTEGGLAKPSVSKLVTTASGKPDAVAKA